VPGALYLARGASSFVTGTVLRIDAACSPSEAIFLATL
jgi:hypothetical protein